MFCVFLLSYRNSRESLGELEKAEETLTCSSCSRSISRSPKLPLMILSLDKNTVHVFYFFNIEGEFAPFPVQSSCSGNTTFGLHNSSKHAIRIFYEVIMSLKKKK